MLGHAREGLCVSGRVRSHERARVNAAAKLDAPRARTSASAGASKLLAPLHEHALAQTRAYARTRKGGHARASVRMRC
eukprot:6173898-Pleurochrysis_carterae.AAC.1